METMTYSTQHENILFAVLIYDVFPVSGGAGVVFISITIDCGQAAE